MNSQAVETTQKRLRILGDDEIEAIYGRPRFTSEERLQYFALSQPEKDLVQEFRSVHSQTYCILQLGYFKAKQLFFTFDLPEFEEDVQFILARYFPHAPIEELSAVNKRTNLRQRRLILELCHYRPCGTQERQQLDAKARQAARVSSKPIYVFRELLQYLAEQRIVAPGYSLLQDTGGQALTHEQNRLLTIVQTHLTNADSEALKRLLDDAQGLYEITLLKREPKDFSLGEIKREIGRGAQIRPLFPVNARIIGADEHESHYVFDLGGFCISPRKGAFQELYRSGTGRVLLPWLTGTDSGRQRAACWNIPFRGFMQRTPKCILSMAISATSATTTPRWHAHRRYSPAQSDNILAIDKSAFPSL